MNIETKEIEIADYDLLESLKVSFKRVWKFKSIVAVCTFVGVLLFVIYYAIVGNTTSYYSSATIFSAVYGSYEESVSGVSTMNTYSGLLRTYRVCDRAAESLAPQGISSERLQKMVKSGQIYLSGASSESKKYGYTLTLVVNTDEPNVVVEITNAMAQAFADEINDLLGTSTLQVLDKATNYGSSNSISVKKYAALFAAAGFFLSCFVIFVAAFFSKKVYSIRQCEMNEDLILGIVPKIENKK